MIISVFFVVNDEDSEDDLENGYNEFQEDEIQLARTLIIVVLVFIICQSVKLVADVYEIVICPSDPKKQCQSPLWIGNNWIST